MSTPLRRRALLLAAGALATALVATGCAASPEVETTTGTEPQTGGTLVFADIELQTDFQTQRGFNYTQANLFRSVLDRLTDVDPDTGEVVPWIASSWTVNDDSTEYTFTIRDGVTFSDGTPLDAEAVKANLDLLGFGDEAKGIVKNRDFINYESSSVDGDTVTVVLSASNKDFLRATAAATSSLVSLGTLALDYAGQADISQIVGSGPFVFESQIADQEISFTRRDDYAWPSSLSTNQGAAYLDRVVYRGIAEVGLRVGAVTSGNVDVARGIQPSDEDAAVAAGITIDSVATPTLTANWIGFRAQTAAVVSDPAVRRALQIGWDRDGLKTTVLSDSYELAGSVLNRTAPGFVDLSDEIAYDPEEAARLLDEAGWVVGDDGIRVKDGQRLEFSVSASPRSVVIRPAVEYLEAEWRKLGVAITNNAGDSAIMTAALGDPSYGAIGSRQFYLGGLGALFGNGNTNTYTTDDELDALFAAQRAATTDEEWSSTVAAIQKRLVVDLGLLIPLWDEAQVHAVSPSVHLSFDGGSAPLLQEAWKVQ